MKNSFKINRIQVLLVVLFSLFSLNHAQAQCVTAIGGIAISNIESTSATFSWTAVSPETGVQYEWEIRTANAPGTGAAGLTVSGSTPNGYNSFTYNALDFSQSYFFYVRYKCGPTTFSPWQATGSNSFTTLTLETPVATGAIFISDVSFIAKWNPVFGASSYRLDVATDAAFTTFVSGYNNLTVNGIYQLVSGLTISTNYYYRVRAVGTGGSGLFTTPNSNEIMLTTLAVPNLTTTWDGTAWSNGTPDASIDAIINGNYNTNSVFSGFICKDLIVNAGKVLTIDSAAGSGPNSNIQVFGAIVNAAGASGIILTTNGNIRQFNSYENSGDITVQRESSPLFRLDYTIWSSPVDGPQTLQQFSPLTLSNRFYKYNTLLNQYEVISSSSLFTKGKGYFIRMPNNWVSNPAIPSPATATGTAAKWTGVFTGVPNNATVNVPLTITGQRFNMVGNPYPCTLNGIKFLQDNGSAITGTLYFWRRTNNPTPGVAANSYYATRTVAAGVAAADAPLVIPNGRIAKGQGFLVQDNSSTGQNAVFFNDGMKNLQTAPQFFKALNNTDADNQESATEEEDLENDGLERNRIWLNVTSAEGAFSQTAICYMTNATNDLDLGDGEYINDGAFAFTSYLNNAEYIIQARALPFIDTDVVAMQFKTPVAGSYTITLAQMDGFFALDQNVYIKDNLTNITHDIKAGPYNFSSEAGTFTDRFQVVYSSLLSTNNPVFNSNSVVVYNKNKVIYMDSGKLAMQSVVVYDMRGSIIFKKEDINSSRFNIANLSAQDQMIIIQITTDQGVVNKKFIFTKE